MPDEPLDEAPAEPVDPQAPSPEARARSKGLTPEQRRFLGTPRAPSEKPEAKPEPIPEAPSPKAPAAALPNKPEAPRPAPSGQARSGPKMIRGAAKAPVEKRREEAEPEAEEAEEVSNEPRAAVSVRGDQKSSRASEMQRAAVILGALFLLVATFYIGKKFTYWKYVLLSSRNQPKLDAVAEKYPGVSADELVSQALAAERAGDTREAAMRLIAAKHKDLTYRGILFRVGKMAYDQNDLVNADAMFERAVAFGENVENSNYFRGLIAVKRKDLAAAQRFFEAAASAGPFVVEYPYCLGETLRMDHRPKEAIAYYEHAALLAKGEHDAICQFKIRLARLEAGDASKVREEIEMQRKAGKLSPDWAMTAAALAIREGKPDEAVPLIIEARGGGDTPEMIPWFTNDFFFVDAAAKQPQLARAYGQEPTLSLELGRRPLVRRRTPQLQSPPSP